MAESAAAIAPRPGGAARAAAAMQAVVVIHGMGEQRPMDTIKGFVRAVWETDDEITRNGLPNPTQVWSKPDPRSGSLELRRITTRETIPSEEFPGGVRTDFYELYWADLSAGSKWDQFVGWVWGLLFRRWRRVPPDVHLAWVLLWLVSLLVAALAIIGILPVKVWQSTPRPMDGRLALALDRGRGRGDGRHSQDRGRHFRAGGPLHASRSRQYRCPRRYPRTRTQTAARAPQGQLQAHHHLSLIHISEPTRP